MLTLEQRIIELERQLRREKSTREELGEVLRGRVSHLGDMLKTVLEMIATQHDTIAILTQAAIETKATLEAQSRLTDTLRAASVPLGGGRRYSPVDAISTQSIPDNI